MCKNTTNYLILTLQITSQREQKTFVRTQRNRLRDADATDYVTERTKSMCKNTTNYVILTLQITSQRE